MKNLLLGLLATSLFVVSCQKDEKPTYLKDDTAASQQPNVAYKQSQTTLMDQAGIKSSPQTGSTMVTAPGMNPPHGQPGHRCEIPVGQPLNGTAAPVQSPNPAAQNIQVNGNNSVKIDPNSIKQNNSAPVKTAPGMNPPHGEPGHRCDIAVGQPLNSKPGAPPVSQTTAANPQPVQVSQPAVANTGPKPELNPAHGEPWHDCAKQVGAPL